MPPIRWLMTIPLLLLAGVAHSAVIEEFTPRGAQLEVGQVRAVFSAAMVPVGRPRPPPLS